MGGNVQVVKGIPLRSCVDVGGILSNLLHRNWKKDAVDWQIDQEDYAQSLSTFYVNSVPYTPMRLFFPSS